MNSSCLKMHTMNSLHMKMFNYLRFFLLFLFFLDFLDFLLPPLTEQPLPLQFSCVLPALLPQSYSYAPHNGLLQLPPPLPSGCHVSLPQYGQTCNGGATRAAGIAAATGAGGIGGAATGAGGIAAATGAGGIAAATGAHLGGGG
jgi:hypothetical protein